MSSTRDNPIQYDKYVQMLKDGMSRKELITFIATERGVQVDSAAVYYTVARKKAKAAQPETNVPESDRIMIASEATKCTPPQCREIATWRLGLNDDQLTLLAKQFGGYVKSADVVKAYHLINSDASKTHEVAF